MHISYPKKNYIVWDLETSGLDPKVDKILEIGYLYIQNGEVKFKESILLNHGIEISETTTKFTGITKEMIDEKGHDPKETFDHLMKMMRDVPQVTHNGLRFDIPFLLEAIWGPMTIGDFEKFRKDLYLNCIDTAVIFKANKLNMPRRFNETFSEWGNRVLDTKAYGLKYNVKTCCEELGIEIENQHRAGDDVLLTNEIYKKLCHN